MALAQRRTLFLINKHRLLLVLRIFIVLIICIYFFFNFSLWKHKPSSRSSRGISSNNLVYKGQVRSRNIKKGTDVIENVLSKGQLDTFLARKSQMEATCKYLKEINATSLHNKKEQIINLQNAFQVRHEYYEPKSWVSYYSMFYVGRKRKQKPRKPVQLDWCPVYKASSSTWLSIFCHLHGAITPETQQRLKNHSLPLLDLAYTFHIRVNPPIRQARPKQLLIPETNHILPYYQMLIVRHPFERILSAYRNRVETIYPGEFYTHLYGYSFVKQFRCKNTSGLYTETATTFPELISYIIEEGTNDPSKLDVHWMPIYSSCPTCLFTFNLILKVETMKSDMEAVFKLLGFTQKSEEYKELMNVWNNYSNSAKVKDKFAIMKKYFSQVSRENIKKLYKLYEIDFIMFNYSAKEYIQIGYE